MKSVCSDSQRVPLLRDQVARHGKHSHASVLKLNCAATEERFIVLAEAKRVENAVRLHISPKHIVHSHPGRCWRSQTVSVERVDEITH